MLSFDLVFVDILCQYAIFKFYCSYSKNFCLSKIYSASVDYSAKFAKRDLRKFGYPGYSRVKIGRQYLFNLFMRAVFIISIVKGMYYQHLLKFGQI